MLRDVFPESREQRCSVCAIANILDAGRIACGRIVKAAALRTIMNAENEKAAELTIDLFEATCGATVPRAVNELSKEREVLLFDFEFHSRALLLFDNRQRH